MKLFGYAILDKQVGAFMPVFFVRAKGEAMRHFMDAVGDQNGRFAKHPGDYDLYELCVFDDVSGSFSGDDGHPVRVLTGLDAKATVDV